MKRHQMCHPAAISFSVGMSGTAFLGPGETRESNNHYAVSILKYKKAFIMTLLGYHKTLIH